MCNSSELSALISSDMIIFWNRYIKFASSSSFGNTFSILAAAIWLPFVPLQAIQVLALNVLYNISQLAIPWYATICNFVISIYKTSPEH